MNTTPQSSSDPSTDGRADATADAAAPELWRPSTSASTVADDLVAHRVPLPRPGA